ncbi:tail sheath protein [Acinetobacter phage Liucustia]|nr:tail sheath protein [Acinetobacter phage Liucustia]
MDFMKNIVDVQITNVTGNTNTTDLNTILILAKHTVFSVAERFRVYRDAAAAKADGFPDKSYVYKALQLAFSQNLRPTQIIVANGLAADADVTAYVKAFDELQTIPQGWLWMVSDLRDSDDQLTLAKAVQATEKFYAIGTSDVNAIDAAVETDIGPLIKVNQLTQAYAWFDVADPDLGEYSATEIALLARCAGKTAGTVQFLLKELVGVPSPDSVVKTPTHQTTLTGKGYTFAAVGNGKTYSYGSGKVGNGDWIDIRLVITWTVVNIRERIFNTLTSLDTLGMDNDGASVIESDVRSVLMEGQDLGMYSRDAPITVTVPDVTMLTKAQRHSRILPRVTFEAQLRGAMIGTVIRGSVYE